MIKKNRLAQFVVGHLELYHTHVLSYSTYVLLYSTMVLLARPTKVRRQTCERVRPLSEASEISRYGSIPEGIPLQSNLRSHFGSHKESHFGSHFGSHFRSHRESHFDSIRNPTSILQGIQLRSQQESHLITLQSHLDFEHSTSSSMVELLVLDLSQASTLTPGKVSPEIARNSRSVQISLSLQKQKPKHHNFHLGSSTTTRSNFS